MGKISTSYAKVKPLFDKRPDNYNKDHKEIISLFQFVQEGVKWKNR